MRTARSGVCDLLLSAGGRARAQSALDALAGQAVSQNAVLRLAQTNLLAAAGLCHQPQARPAITACNGLAGHLSQAQDQPGHKIYPYLLRDLSITRPNQVWNADITYLPLPHGFMYLVAIIDWFSRYVLA